MPVNKHDFRRARCPMLGHDIDFSYCRQPGSEIPCRKIFDCWWEIFDIEGFIRTNFTPEQIEQILSPRKDKACTIVELIEKARSADKKK